MDAVDVAAAAAAALDGAVLHGMPPSPLVADLTQRHLRGPPERHDGAGTAAAERTTPPAGGAPSTEPPARPEHDPPYRT